MVVGPVALAALTGGFLLLGLFGPLVANRRWRRLRAPTDRDRERLTGRWPGGWPMPSSVEVIETVGDRSIEVAIRGPPGWRVLFVTDFILEDLDGATAEALLAAEAARTAWWYREYQVASAAVTLAVGTAAFAGVIPFVPGFAALLLGAAALLAGGRWLQFRADRAAANALGPDRLADAFETVARLRDVDIETGGWRRYLEVQPALGDRIDRLRSSATDH